MKTNERVKEDFDEIKEDFSSLDSPMEKIQYIIDLAKDFKNDESAKLEKYRIQGCVSEAYIAVEKSQNNEDTIIINYYADALIIQGFLAILKQCLDDSVHSKLGENIDLFKQFSREVGLEQFLSPNRANALHNIILKLEWY